jgi:ribosome-associated translation inhibitor RaiA
VYSVVVRSVITYDNNTWHASHDRSNTILFLTNKLINLQKQNLRTINETFRITSRKILNVETQMQFIELHLAYLQTKIRIRLHEDSHNTLIIKHCDRIKRKLTQMRERRRRQVDITSKERKRVWFAKLCAENESTMQNDNSMTNKSLKKTLHDRWKRFWDEYQTKNRRRDCIALTSQIFKKRLKLHDNLFKIENNLVTQMRTNRIELTKYLFHRRVFIIVISACFCDWFRQTLKHVMLFCLNHNRTRESMLLVVETQNLRRLLNINKKIRVMTRWLMKTDILAQFSLAIECLEWFRSAVWAKRMHTKSTDRSQYFAFKTITCRLDDERAERDFYSSEDFFFIHIVYSNSRMSRLKSMTQRVWNIIIITFCFEKTLWINVSCDKKKRSYKNILRIFEHNSWTLKSTSK